MIRYWLTPPADPQKDETITAICRVYHEAPALAKQGERTVSTDELTGVQALERKHPGLPWPQAMYNDGKSRTSVMAPVAFFSVATS